MRHLLVIFGDQLSLGLASLVRADARRDGVLMMEVADEAATVNHHKKKLAFLFSAMRHFRDELTSAGWATDYVAMDDAGNSGSFEFEIKRAVARHGPERLVFVEPGEWRVFQMIKALEDSLGLPVDILADDRFLCSREDFARWAEGRRELRMEYFYREMRRKTGLLMCGDKPEGGRWNYDAENRKPAQDDLFMPVPKRFSPDATTREVIEMVDQRFPDHFGTLAGFGYAVTRADAEACLAHFIDHALPSFGDYQDAMLKGQPHLYHSVLSPYINVGLLDPVEVCRRASAAYIQGRAPLNAVEGFIRQIIGWREYVRGIYWLKMPEYEGMNALKATRKLPDFYWTADTDMACLKDAIGLTLEHAYAHHIQRLMITGNFALLAGVDPREVHEWYLAVYIDAFEWVEMPNTIGMSQFADGGIMASKPYAASANYISRMSDYCEGCRYRADAKTGTDACPFNALYWDFLHRNQEVLARNPRLRNPYATWGRMSAEKQAAYLDSAARFLARLDGEDTPGAGEAA